MQDMRVTDPDADRLELVWRKEGAKLWRSLLAFTADPETASDAMAEAFAQALARGDGVRDPERWIWRASFRIAAGELKRRRQEGLPEADGWYEMAPQTVDLVRALRGLSPNQRAAAVLHLYADLPTREVASILRIAPSTVRVHVSLATRRLRKMLGDDDG